MAVTVKKQSPVETAIVLDFSRSMDSIFKDLIAKVREISEVFINPVVQGLIKGITNLAIAKFVDKGTHPVIDFRYNV